MLCTIIRILGHKIHNHKTNVSLLNVAFSTLESYILEVFIHYIHHIILILMYILIFISIYIRLSDS